MSNSDKEVKQSKNIKKGETSENLVVRKKESSLYEFVKRNIPSDEDVQEFEKYIEVQKKDDEMEKGLARIYESEDGEKKNINILDKKISMGMIGWFFSLLTVFVVLVSGVWGYYTFVFVAGGAVDNVSLSLIGPTNVSVLEDIVYEVKYSNPTAVALENVEIKIVYPEDFLFIDSSPALEGDNTLYKISRVLAGGSGSIEIRGRLIGRKEKKEIVLVNMTWSPENSEAEFRREQALESVINNTGLSFVFEAEQNIMAGQNSSLKIKLNKEENNYINNFTLRIDPKEDIEILSVKGVKDAVESDNQDGGDELVVAYVEKISESTWDILGIDKGLSEIIVEFKVLNKVNKEEDLRLSFEIKPEIGKTRQFYQEDLTLHVVKNDFNISLILNGSTGEQGASFGDTLNYSLIYSNQGEADVHDAVVMAVLNSDVLNWSSFKSKQEGVVRDGAISWTYRELPTLKSIKSKDEGVIDFSINVSSLKDLKSKINKISKFEIDSYAQYSLGFSGTSTPPETEDTKSNVIKVKLNSDLLLSENVRYFNDDNIAVGLGPIPPKVNEDTIYRVYWRVTNNLHKVSGLKIKTKLAANVTWVKSFEPNIGNMHFDGTTNEVVWSIGDLPIAEIDGVAEFDINVRPTEGDKGKVMVLLTGTSISAQDKVTNSKINISTNAKTTKLSDDEIAESDGIVR
ncbi:hypothetical protein ISS03_02300 [Patescibacteria group bacterium]|nr:hypothetical protein [Patescibacteria group bacterium]